MGQGLEIYNPAGQLTFSAELSTGGVCLGFKDIPAGGAEYSYPAYPTEEGLVLSCGNGVGAFVYTTDRTQGFLRFNFPAIAAGSKVTLFVL